MPHEELPYWHFNVPLQERTAECPDFLLNLDDKDKRMIGSWDSNYEAKSWDEVNQLIRTNRIDGFQRAPIDLRRYRQFIHAVKIEWGSVLQFILETRIHWTDTEPKGLPFTCPGDIKILFNDWPYGVDPKIVHLVVWTKFELPEDAATNDLTPQARALIEKYVNKTFADRLGKDNVVWFKNWKSLKSVHAIEHFHVMLNNPDPKFVQEITNGDVPLSAALQNAGAIKLANTHPEGVMETAVL